MRKIIWLVLGLLILTSQLNAGDFSANAELLYSFRHKCFAGDFNITREKTFLNGWLKAKLGVIPEIGVDKEQEFIAGVSIDLLKKWKEKEDCPFLIKNSYLGLSGNLGVIPNEDIKKTRFDGLAGMIKYGWQF